MKTTNTQEEVKMTNSNNSTVEENVNSAKVEEAITMKENTNNTVNAVDVKAAKATADKALEDAKKAMADAKATAKAAYEAAKAAARKAKAEAAKKALIEEQSTKVADAIIGEDGKMLLIVEREGMADGAQAYILTKGLKKVRIKNRFYEYLLEDDKATRLNEYELDICIAKEKEKIRKEKAAKK